MTTSSAPSLQLRQPTSKCTWVPSQCPIYLVSLLEELRTFYPDLYLFVVENKIVHLGSGKYLVGDAADVASVEEAQGAKPLLATPKRRTVSRTVSSPSATLNLSNTQRQMFQEAPAIVSRTDAILSSLIDMCMPTQAVRNLLFDECGTGGRAKLLYIEKRGTGAAGTPLALLAREELQAREKRGISAPISSISWMAYAQELEQVAAGAGGITEAAMADHLRMPLYSLPEKLSEKVLSASESLTKTTDIVAAVAAAIDKFDLAAQLTNRRRDPTYGAASLATTLANTAEPMDGADAQAVLYGQRSYGPPKDPTKNLTMEGIDTTRRNPTDARTYMWNPAEHSPCLNWIRGRDGCNGRHFLPQCPLPRLAGAVTLTAEDTPAPTEFAPAAVLTAVPAEPIAAAARDFSSLFMGGPKEILHNHGITSVLSVVAVTADDILPEHRSVWDDFPETGVE